MLGTLECADEVREIEVLGRRARRLQSPSLAALAHRRWIALWQAIRTTMDDTNDLVADATGWYPITEPPALDARLLLVTTRLGRGLATLLAWVQQAQATRDGDTLREMHNRLTRHATHVACIHRAVQDAVRAGVALPAESLEEHVRCVGVATSVELSEIGAHLTAAAHEWARPSDDQVHAELVERCRHFGNSLTGAAPRLKGEPGPRVRVDRMEALAVLYRALPVVRASVAITAAVELTGRVIRDVPLIEAVREASRPRLLDGGAGAVPTDDHPLVWRAAVVALGLMAQMPTDADIAACLALESTDRVAVVLASVLADPQAAREIVDRMLQGAGRGDAAALSLAKRRIELGRLITVVG